jgi:hypothetical protein
MNIWLNIIFRCFWNNTLQHIQTKYEQLKIENNTYNNSKTINVIF